MYTAPVAGASLISSNSSTGHSRSDTYEQCMPNSGDQRNRIMYAWRTTFRLMGTTNSQRAGLAQTAVVAGRNQEPEDEEHMRSSAHVRSQLIPKELRGRHTASNQPVATCVGNPTDPARMQPPNSGCKSPVKFLRTCSGFPA